MSRKSFSRPREDTGLLLTSEDESTSSSTSTPRTENKASNQTDSISSVSTASGSAALSEEEMTIPDPPQVEMTNGASPSKAKSQHRGLEDFRPPDGGFWAWLVVVASFLTNGIIFGTINSFGVIFVYLKEQYSEEPGAATKASLVGSVAVGATFFLSFLSGILCDKFGLRLTAMIGGFLAFLGMLLSSFFVDRIEVLFLTYGLLFGGGSSLVYTPSLSILGHYFRRHMGVVNGITTAGSSIFTIAMPMVLEGLLSSYGLVNCFRFLSCLTFLLMLTSLTFIPIMPKVTASEASEASCFKKLVNVENWKNKKYLIWTLAVPSALFGYFVPYVHIVQHVKDLLPGQNGGTLVTCIGITSGLGRIIFGKIADLPRVNRIFLQQVSFVSIGLCTMLLTAAPFFGDFKFEAMIVFALIMGLFDGCFITMLGPIAFDICGPAGASQAIGFLLGMCSIPLTVGPPVAGILYDVLGNYTVAFLLAGCPPLIGAAFMCLIYKVSGPTQSLEIEAGEADEGAAENLLGNGTSSGLPNTVTKTTLLSEKSCDDFREIGDSDVKT